MCKSVLGGRVYYLESAKDITELYEERDNFYAQYRVVMLVLIGISSLVIFVLSHLLTRVSSLTSASSAVTGIGLNW